MEKRVRSPNYPALSLPEAVQRVAMVYKNQHKHGAPRDVVARSMGYNTLNGASATAISALSKYGLLEGRTDDVRVSDRAMRILHPESQAEKAQALREAAGEPTLFRELDEKFPGPMPSEDILRNHLIRSGFATSAVSSVILAYRETKDFADRESGGYDSGPVEQPHPESHPMQPATSNAAQPPIFMPYGQENQGDGRNIVLYSFEDGGLLKISVVGDISTEEALEMAETQIAIKRREIERRNARAKMQPTLPSDKGLDIDGEDDA